MRLLALDTSVAQCGAAILSGTDLVDTRVEPMARGQAERLLPMARDMLRDAGLAWRDLDALAVGIGPGNFTGIRIAVSAVRGLALALDIPAIGVSTFEALAHGHSGPVLVVLDGRRDRIYVQGFRGAVPTAPALMAEGDLAGHAQPAGTRVVGYRAAQIAAALGLTAISEVDTPPPAAIAAVAAGRSGPHAPPAPLYLRGADAAPPAEQPPVILDDA